MHYLVPDKALKGQTSIRFHLISRNKCCFEPVEIKTRYSIHKMLFFAAHTIFIMQRKERIVCFSKSSYKVVILDILLTWITQLCFHSH